MKELKRIPNQDQPASSMTKFEKAVFMVLQGYCGNHRNIDGSFMQEREISELAISTVKETFKQLENETEHQKLS